MKLFDHSHFKKMSWKNGGGTTLELFSIRDEAGEILFRLSSAEVKQDGPFSLFPHIDRILFLVDGEGFRLTFPEKSIVMDQTLRPITFAGEDEIHCELIQGPCTDFNVMTDRRFAESKLYILDLTRDREIKAKSSYLFIYIPRNQILIQLQQNEIYHHIQDNAQAYIIEVSLK